MMYTRWTMDLYLANINSLLLRKRRSAEMQMKYLVFHTNLLWKVWFCQRKHVWKLARAATVYCRRRYTGGVIKSVHNKLMLYATNDREPVSLAGHCRPHFIVDFVLWRQRLRKGCLTLENRRLSFFALCYLIGADPTFLSFNLRRSVYGSTICW